MMKRALLNPIITAAIVFLVIVLPIVLCTVIPHSSEAGVFFYIYGDPQCPHCTSMKKFIASTYGEDSYYFCDLRSNNTCLQKYLELTSTIKVPQYVPLIILLNNCSVKAIVIGGVEDKEFLDSLLYSNTTSETIPVYMGTTHIKDISISDPRAFIISYASGKTCNLRIVGNGTTATSGININVTWTRNPTLLDVLPQLLILSLLDSINPCTIAMYTVFIASRRPGREALVSGLLFIVIIYIGYLMVAAGLLAVIYVIPPWIFLLLAAILAIYNLARIGRRGEGEACRECGAWTKFAKLLANNYILSIVLALYSVTALLPCSAGPLFVFLTIIHNLPYYQAITGILLYNIVFISPLLIILIMTTRLGKAKPVIEWINNNNEVLGFISSVILLFIVIILFIQL